MELAQGLIFGVLIVILSNWIFLPLIRQYVFNYPRQPLFAGFNGSNPMVCCPASSSSPASVLGSASSMG